MTQELWIENTQGELAAVDIGDTPALVVQGLDLFNLTAVKANYFQSTKIPITPNNLSVFGFPNITGNSKAQAQVNKPLAVRYYVNGVNVLSEKYVCSITKVTSKTIELLIRAEKAEVLQALKDYDPRIAEGLDVIRRSSAGFQSTSSYCRFLAALMQVDSETSAQNPTYGISPSPDLDMQFAVPFVNLKEMCSRVCLSAGISADLSAARNDLLVKLNPVRSDEISAFGLVNVWYHQSQSDEDTGIYTSSSVFNDQSGDGKLNSLRSSYGTGVFMQFNVDCDCAIKVKISTADDEFKYPSLGIRVYVDSTITGRVFEMDAPLTMGESFEFSFNAERGGKYQIGFGANGHTDEDGDYYYICGLEATYEPSWRADDAYVGDNINIAKSLPFENSYDIIKLLSDCSGCFIQVKNRTISLVRMSNLKDEDAIDFSSRFVSAEELNFAPSNIGQSNFIQFEPSRVEENVDKSYFDSGNKNLEKESVLLQIKSMSSRSSLLSLSVYSGQTRSGVISTPAIDAAHYVVEYAGSGTSTVNYPDSISEVSQSSPVVATSTPLPAQAGLKLRWSRHSFATVTDALSPDAYVASDVATPITAEQIRDLFSETYDSLLESPLVLTAMLMLTAEDIASFDQLKPIYLAQYAAYFYVSRISNFVANRPTKCELIRL